MKRTMKHYLLAGLKGASAVLGISMALCLPTVAIAGPTGYVNPDRTVQQQDGRTVKGHVVDETGEPMIGVTVMPKSGKGGTITDLDGNFTIKVNQGETLQLTYTGYKAKTVSVGSSAQLNIAMEPDAVGLEDVVVIGYGTVKKRDLTGAVQTMKTEDIVVSPTSNVMEALQGKIAGMDITKGSGQVGSGVDILLRGSRSIYGSNSPLFIIDGLPGSYDDLSPNDIESIDVMKDASATAIYGSAGANGVVIITTKRGNVGKTNVNFDAYYGWSGSPTYKHGMQGEEWLNYHREAYNYKNGFYPENITTLFGGNEDYIDAYENGKWIDWVDEASGNTATTQKYSLSIQGGTDKTKVYASLVYNRDEGLLANETLDKYSVRLNLDQKLFDWATAGVSTNVVYSIKDTGVKNTFTKSLTAFPLGDVRDEYGDLNREYIKDQYSPLGDLIENQYANNNRSTYVNAVGYLEIAPVKGLKLRSQVNAILSHNRNGLYWGAYANANRPSYAGTPHAALRYSDTYKYNWENILSYNITLAKDHDLSFTGVTSWQKNGSESAMAEGSGQEIDSWQYWRLLSAGSPYVNSDFAQTQKMSYAVRFNYSYKGRYLVTFSNRWDGVSFFTEGNKWDSFPAGALAWRISDEAFMEGTRDWLDNLKLRIGAGITGNSGGVGAYGTVTTVYKYSASGISINGNYVPFTQYSGFYDSPSLGWEKSYNWNFGLDFSLFGGRIDASVDYFTTITRGLLFSRTMPITSGATGWGSPLKSWENLAKTSNKGLEFTINSRNIKTKDFTWNTTLTAAWEKERIEKLPEGDIIAENLFEGNAIHSIYDYKYAGIWGTNASQEELDIYGVKPGWVKIETNEKFTTVDGKEVSDNGKHKYNQDDRRILGHTNPNWIFGLNNTFTYKDFDLTVYAMARFGQTIYSSLLGYYDAKSSITTNQISGIDYWTENNQGAYYPRPGSGDDQTVGNTATRIYDGSFVKIKNITLGYTLPKNISRKALMEKCRFYFTAYNPYIFCVESKLKGTDPETGGSDAFPTYKQFVFGVNITF